MTLAQITCFLKVDIQHFVKFVMSMLVVIVSSFIGFIPDIFLKSIKQFLKFHSLNCVRECEYNKETLFW